MFLGQARKLCPTLKVVSYDFPLYEELSEKVVKNSIVFGIIVLSSSVCSAPVLSYDDHFALHCYCTSIY
jgi:hypothetical protein